MKLRFAFTESDHDRYGSGTWTFDAAELVRQPTRELIAIEATIGMGIPALLARLKMPTDRRYTESLLAATWVARRLAGQVEMYDDTYNPLVYLMTVEMVEDDDVDPPAGTPSDSRVSAEG